MDDRIELIEMAYAAVYSALAVKNEDLWELIHMTAVGWLTDDGVELSPEADEQLGTLIGEAMTACQRAAEGALEKWEAEVKAEHAARAKQEDA